MISSVTNDRCYEFRGLSSDKKPIGGVGNGSIFLEIDTCRVFCFNEASSTWVELK